MYPRILLSVCTCVYGLFNATGIFTVFIKEKLPVELVHHVSNKNVLVCDIRTMKILLIL